VLPQTERRRPARAAGERNAQQLEDGDDGGLVRRDAVDALAEVEREVDFSAAEPLDPTPIEVDGNTNDLIPLDDERLLDRLDRLENEEVGRLAECGQTIE
jgi:hypothetical protein